MMITTTLAALLISDDNALFQRIRNSLRDRFNMQLSRYGEDQLWDSLRHDKPLVVIWDGQNPSPKWSHLIDWIREHFHGRPIIALLRENDGLMDEKLNQHGIHLILDMSSDSYIDRLLVNIFAIILDYEREKTKVLEQCVE